VKVFKPKTGNENVHEIHSSEAGVVNSTVSKICQ